MNCYGSDLDRKTTLGVAYKARNSKEKRAAVNARKALLATGNTSMDQCSASTCSSHYSATGVSTAPPISVEFVNATRPEACTAPSQPRDVRQPSLGSFQPILKYADGRLDSLSFGSLNDDDLSSGLLGSSPFDDAHSVGASLGDHSTSSFRFGGENKTREPMHPPDLVRKGHKKMGAHGVSGHRCILRRALAKLR